MGFGKNPFVAKAETAEQKATETSDDSTRTRALRDAAHQWDRAAEREKPGSKARTEYEAHAERCRAAADGEVAEAEPEAVEEEEVVTVPSGRRILN